MKLTCPSCSSKINSAKPLAVGVRVKCPKCGKPFKVSDPSTKSSSAPGAPPPSRPSSPSVPPPSTTAPPAPVVSTNYTRRKKAKSGATKWIVACSVLALAVVGGVVFFIMQSQKPSDDETPKNGKQSVAAKQKQADKKDDGDKKIEPKNEKPKPKPPVKPKPPAKGEWTPYTDKTADYSARFPTEPKQQIEKQGKTEFTTTQATTAEKENFLVSHFVVGDDVIKKGIDEYLAGFVVDAGNTRQRMRFIQLGTIPGVEVEWKEKVNDKFVLSVDRYFVFKNNVYQITAKADGAVFDTKKALKFLDSFQLLSTPNQKVTDRRKGASPAPIANRFEDMKAITRAAFSPKGNFVATFGGVDAAKQTVMLWKHPSKLMHRSVESPPVVVNKLAISPDELYLAAVGGLQLHIWTVKDGRKLHTVKLGDAKSALPASLLEFSADGKHVVTVGDNSGVAVEIKSGKLLKHESHLSKKPAAFVYCPGKHIAATIYHDPKTKRNPMAIWDIKAGKSVNIAPLELPVGSAAFSRDGNLFAASYGMNDPFVIFHKPGPAVKDKPWPSQKHLVVSAAGFRHYSPLILSHRGGYMAGVPRFEKPALTKLHLWDLAAPTGPRIIECPNLADLVLAPDGETLVLTFDLGAMQFINIKNGAKATGPKSPTVVVAKNPKDPKKPTPKKTEPSKELVMKLKKTWKPFSPPKSSITVLAPTAPAILRKGDANSMTVFVTKPTPKDPAKAKFMIAYQSTPEGFRKKTVDEQLAEIELHVRDEFGLGTDVVKRTPIMVGGRKGREIVVKKGKGTYYSRIFVADTQWAAMSMMQADSQDDLVARKVYFDSIQFGKAPPLPIVNRPMPIAHWITYVSPTAGYSVKLPGSPKKLVSGRGKGFDVYGVLDAKSKIPFFVREMKIPKSKIGEDVKTQYQTVKKLLLGKAKYELLEDKDVKFDERLGVEMVVLIDEQLTYIRIFATNKFWLVFNAKTGPAKTPPIEVSEFFKSISFDDKPAPKKPAPKKQPPKKVGQVDGSNSRWQDQSPVALGFIDIPYISSRAARIFQKP